MEASTESQNGPQHIEALIRQVRQECLSEMHHYSLNRGRALYEMAADVLEGLEKAFHEFGIKGEVFSDSDEGISPKSLEPWD